MMTDRSNSPATALAGDKAASPHKKAVPDNKASSEKKVWPLLPSLQAYRPAFLSHDLFAGLTLAAIAIPEQMATARLGGFTPQTGFFAFLAGSLAFAVFGRNRFLSCGADSTITPIFAGGLAAMAAAGSPEYPMLAGALALMVGLLLLSAGVFRLGSIADMLSIPVTTGFLVGISVHILISQLPDILGMPMPGGAMLQRLATMALHANETNGFTLLIGLGVLAIILACERIDARIPGALIALAAASLVDFWFDLKRSGVSVLGAVSVAPPTLTVPAISLSHLSGLVSLGLIIAVIIMVQTAATTRSFPSEPDQPPDVDRDFVGVGAGCLLSGLIGAFPVNASPPRTAVVSETGGRSQFAGLAAVAIIIALLAFGTALLGHIPNAALAGVLLFVAQRIVRFNLIVAIFRQSRGEFLLIMATALAIIVLPIAQGVGIGIALSLLHGIWSTTRSRVVMFERVSGTSIWWPVSPNIPGEQEAGVIVAGFQAPLSFLNAYDFRRDLLSALQGAAETPRLMILEATGIVEIDFTAAQVLRDLIRQCQADGVDFAIARLESVRAQQAMARFGVNDVLGPDRQFQSVEQAIKARLADSSPRRPIEAPIRP